MATFSLADLDPQFRAIYDTVLDVCALVARESHDPLFGCTIFPVCTHMDPSEASAHDALHTLRRGPWRRSRAVDVILLRHGRPVPHGDAAWTRYGEIAREHGLTWGGDWFEPDVTHVELPMPDDRRAMRDRL